MSIIDRVREHTREHKRGMLYDLMFAVIWVTFVSALFDTVFAGAPRFAFYLLLATGVPAYFAFFWSLELAKRGNGA